MVCTETLLTPSSWQRWQYSFVHNLQLRRALINDLPISNFSIFKEQNTVFVHTHVRYSFIHILIYEHILQFASSHLASLNLAQIVEISCY
jgi:hypothetical protein